MELLHCSVTYPQVCAGTDSLHKVLQVVARAAAAEKRAKKPAAQQMVEDIREDRCKLSLQDVNTLLQCLWEKREAMEKEEAEASLQLLLQFLHHAR